MNLPSYVVVTSRAQIYNPEIVARMERALAAMDAPGDTPWRAVCDAEFPRLESRGRIVPIVVRLDCLPVTLVWARSLADVEAALNA